MIENNDVTSNRCVVWLCFLKQKDTQDKKNHSPTKKNGGKLQASKGQHKIYERPEIPEAKTPTCMPQAKVILATAPQRNPPFDWQKKQAAAINCSKTLHKMLHEPLYWLDLIGSEEFAKIQKLFLSQVISLLSTPTHRESHKVCVFWRLQQKRLR